MSRLPLSIGHVGVPPIKCQGIKTKLVPFIFSSVKWDAPDGVRWIEPFLGSGVVAFNLAPEHALLADSNRHIIGFYQAILGKMPTLRRSGLAWRCTSVVTSIMLAQAKTTATRWMRRCLSSPVARRLMSAGISGANT